MKTILAIAGSLREKSLNTSLLHAAKKHLKEGFQMDIASIKEIPLYNEDEEKEHGIPQAVQKLKDKLKHADAFLIATPEYNHSIPGTLKNAIDYLTRPPKDQKEIFWQKKTGLIGVAPSPMGTVHAQAAWLPVLRYLNVHPYFGKHLFLGRAKELFDEAGNLVDETANKKVFDYIQGFCEFIEK